jgi:hypothetical protein
MGALLREELCSVPPRGLRAGALYATAFFFFLLNLPCAFSAKPDQSKTQAPSVEPSVGYDANAATLRGETCEVPLKAIPAHGYEIQFAIVPGSGPRHGSLSGPVRNSKGSVSYFYTHNGAKGATQDSFRFKFKSGPKKSWSYKTASISIKEPPPRLVTQSDLLDFGHVFIGESRTLPLVVKNAGGGVLEAALKVGAPWELVTEPVFKLAEGESRKILIRFMPLSDDTQQGRLFFETGINSRTEIALQGIGGFRFDVPPAIAFAKEAGPAGLRLPVTNLSPEPLSLRINAPLPLEAPQTLELAPLASAELILTLPARPFAERHVLVSLSDGAAMRDVKVSLPAPPAPLEWRGESPQLGKTTPGRSRPLTATLHNLGSLPATVTLAVEGDGLSLADSQPKSVEIAPDAFATVNATWQYPARPGPATVRLLASHGGVVHPWEFSAEMTSPSAPDEPGPAPLTPSQPSPTPRPFSVLTAAEQEALRLRLPDKIRYTLAPHWKTATATVLWDYHGPGDVQFTIEREGAERVADPLANPFQKRLVVPKELPKPEVHTRWRPVDAASIQRREDGTWTAIVTDLKPGYHNIRIVTRQAGGNRTDYSSFPILVGTLPPSPYWHASMLVGFVLCAGYLLRKKIRSLFS